MKSFNFESIGEVSTASGQGWYYDRVGNNIIFKQTGKVPSLRIIKTLIKLIEKGNKNEN